MHGTLGGTTPLIVGIGGTTRAGSSTEMALRTALAAAERMGARTRAVVGPELDLPMYDPANAERDETARRLVAALAEADGVIVATPAYHGSLSGLVKNALDYVEDLREAPRPYLDGRAVGLLVTAHGPQALGTSLVAARSVVHALRGWPTPFAATFSARDRPFVDGAPANEEVAAQVERVAHQVVTFAAAQRLLAEAEAAQARRPAGLAR